MCLLYTCQTWMGGLLSISRVKAANRTYRSGWNKTNSSTAMKRFHCGCNKWRGLILLGNSLMGWRRRYAKSWWPQRPRDEQVCEAPKQLSSGWLDWHQPSVFWGVRWCWLILFSYVKKKMEKRKKKTHTHRHMRYQIRRANIQVPDVDTCVTIWHLYMYV